MPDPVNIVGPGGQVVQAVPLSGGGFMPYKKDPNAIFEVFNLCMTCAAGLAILFRNRQRQIKYIPAISNKPLDS